MLFAKSGFQNGFKNGMGQVLVVISVLQIRGNRDSLKDNSPISHKSMPSSAPVGQVVFLQVLRFSPTSD